MKKLFLLALVFSTGCLQTTIGGVPRTVIFPQRGIMLTPTNQCTPQGRVIQAGVGIVRDSLAYGEFDNVPLIPPIFSGSQTIEVMFQGYSSDWKRLLGVTTQTFYIDQNSTTSKIWLIGGQGQHLYDINGNDICRR